MIGRSIRMPFDLLRTEPPARKSVHFTDQVKQHVETRQNRYKSYADDRRRAQPSNLKKGDSVESNNMSDTTS